VPVLILGLAVAPGFFLLILLVMPRCSGWPSVLRPSL
jgi:hypothetical protein